MLSTLNNYYFGLPSSWQGVDVEPTENSQNLVESGSVYFNEKKP